VLVNIACLQTFGTRPFFFHVENVPLLISENRYPGSALEVQDFPLTAY
jgi:hypothetical protein